MLGPTKGDAKEVTMLNRLVLWTEGGVEYEAEPGKVGRVIVDLVLEGATQVGTAGVKMGRAMLEKYAPLEDHKHMLYRAITAMCDYVAADRPDAQYASKALRWWTASPYRDDSARG